MTLAPGLQLIDLALYYMGARRTLVLADVHLGFEEALHQEGTLVPRGHFQKLMARLERILDHLTPKCPLDGVIINGDLRHPFGHLTSREWREAHEFFARLERISKKIIVLEGNHDAHLEFLGESNPMVQVASVYELDDLLFLHGHSEPGRIPSHIQTIVIGHEHPAVGLRDPVTGRIELYKCCLVGRYHQVRLIVQPSFNPLVAGSDLTQERCLSPLLDEETLGDFEVYPISDEGSVYRFGLLRRLLATRSAARR